MEGSESRGQKGLVFNIQRFSIHDGPGIRTTVFFKGCPLNCQWCSNPESIAGHPEVWFLDIKCIKGCRRCIEICPQGAVEVADGLVTGIDRSRCDLCMKCVPACPSGAMEKIGQYMTEEEVVEEVAKDLIFYQHSGGGMTFSGGEPALQGEFVRRVAEHCKQRAIDTALDTAGCVRWETLEQLLPSLGLVLYDVKHMDSKRHEEGTGVPNRLILDNLRKLAPRARVWLRVPVIPGYNDSEPQIRAIAEFSRGLPIEKISLLPYHSAAERKHHRLGRDYLCKGTPLPSREHMERLKQIVESYGHKVTIGR